MDRLKRSRAPVRAQITRSVNDCDALLQQENIDKVLITAKMHTIQTHHDKLEDLNQKVVDAMLDAEATDEDLNKEMEEQTEYKDKFFIIKTKVEDILTPRIVLSAPPQSEYGTAVVNEERKNANYRLPQIELMKFSGELIDWLHFWSQFEPIHEDLQIDKRTKFQHLKNCMVKETEAYEMVKGHILHPDNYDVVVDALKKRFGNDKVLHQMYIRELLKLQIHNTNKEKFATFWLRTESHLRSLKTLNLEKVDSDNWLIPIVESNIPEDILLNWQLSSESKHDGSKDNPPRTQLDILVQFVGSQMEAKRNVELAHEGLKSNDKPKERGKTTQLERRKKDDIPTAMGLVSVDQKNECCFCGKGHASQDCLIALKMDVEERRKRVKEGNRCFACLRQSTKNHRASNCRSAVKCVVCNGHHYPIVCLEIASNKKKDEHGAVNLEKKLETVTIDEIPQSSCANYVSNFEVLIPNLLVEVVGENGKVCNVRMGVDTYSQHSYIKNELATKMGYKPIGKSIFNHAVFGGEIVPEIHPKFNIELKSVHGTFGCKLPVFGQKEITSATPAIASKEVLQEMKEYGIELCDALDSAKKIDILIGADFAGKILTGKRIELKCGPVAMQTRFGWFVMGKPTPTKRRNDADEFIVTSLVNLQSPTMFWELEAVGIMDPSTKKSKHELDEETLNHFRRTVTRKEDGRYQVKLPWIDGHPPLPTNKTIALKRLENATRKMNSQGQYEAYGKVFEEWMEMGIIEVAMKNELDYGCHYLPHRPVFKPESTTTKVRPVFDASCKSARSGKVNTNGGGGVSLNDCLVKGPNLLELIPDLLLRFREKKIAATADIRKAFLMIEIAPEDREYLRFLWWKDSDENNDKRDMATKTGGIGRILETFRHCRVVFGMNCSPFLLGAVIEHHLKTSNMIDAELTNKLLKSLYVDNLVASFDDESEFKMFKEKSIEVLRDAKFDLRMWETNLDETLSHEASGLLGIKWDKTNDVLFCEVDTCDGKVEKITKRIMLSLTAKVFDPLGILAPVTLIPKTLLQKCWQEKQGWDDEVDPHIAKEFQRWIEELPHLNLGRIARFMGKPDRDDSLHIFCDASKSGYAAVAFLRRIMNNDVQINFVMCRSRVAPLHETTINRLELVACEIGARLCKNIVDALNWNDVRVYYWTDSSTARAWIINDKDWGTFVGNRVRKILAISSASQWNYVPGNMNPADIPSRGCGIKQLLDLSWWDGPEWLKNPPSCWPNEAVEENECDIMREAKKTTVVTLSVEEWFSPTQCKVNNYAGLVKVVAWMRRLLRKGKDAPKELQPEELRIAERRLLYQVQRGNINQEKISLELVRDEEGLLRVKTKLTNRTDEESFKEPIIIPGNHYVTALLIKREHLRYNHAGPQFLIAKIRETVWITGARRAVNKVIDKCVTCQRFRAKSIQRSTAPLPDDRVRDADPFEIVGIDLAGPLFLKGGEKVWICLFTCATVRAVHLELVSSLSTEAFLLCFRRFIARRGRPAIIYTDNGTNFVGARRMMASLNWEKLQKETEMDMIKWNLIPPSSPWWGGFWERMVRSVKGLLYRMLGKKILMMEELATLLCDVESVINGRPLTYVFENDVVQPLSPSMFICGVRVSGVPEVDELDRTAFKNRYKLRQKLMEDLRGRFRKEYLGLLVQRRQEKGYAKVKVGDVVMIGSDNFKRIMWPVGVVQEIIVGRDGVERLAKVRTSTGVLVRPFQRLYPMEVNDHEGVLKEKVSRYGRNIRKPDRLKK